MPVLCSTHTHTRVQRVWVSFLGGINSTIRQRARWMEDKRELSLSVSGAVAEEVNWMFVSCIPSSFLCSLVLSSDGSWFVLNCRPTDLIQCYSRTAMLMRMMMTTMHNYLFFKLLLLCYFIRVPISFCSRSSYSSWGQQKWHTTKTKQQLKWSYDWQSGARLTCVFCLRSQAHHYLFGTAPSCTPSAWQRIRCWSPALVHTESLSVGVVYYSSLLQTKSEPWPSRPI